MAEDRAESKATREGSIESVYHQWVDGSYKDIYPGSALKVARQGDYIFFFRGERNEHLRSNPLYRDWPAEPCLIVFVAIALSIALGPFMCNCYRMPYPVYWLLLAGIWSGAYRLLKSLPAGVHVPTKLFGIDMERKMLIPDMLATGSKSAHKKIPWAEIASFRTWRGSNGDNVSYHIEIITRRQEHLAVYNFQNEYREMEMAAKMLGDLCQKPVLLMH